MEKQFSFGNPHDVGPIPGTEGWQKMYPYYYQFVPKGVDPVLEEYENSQMWFVDSLHQSAPLLPFESNVDDFWWPCVSQMHTRVLCFPPARGLDHRMLNGWVYIAGLAEEDPQVVEKKAQVVQKRLEMTFTDWEKWMEKWKEKQYKNSKRVDEINFGDLPEMVDDAMISNHLGYSPASQMRRDYWKLMDIIDLCWEQHFEFFTAGLAIYVGFTDFCKACFPSITDTTIGKMCTGAVHDSYLPEIKLQELAKLAIDLGVADAIMGPGDATEVEARLEKTPDGRKWKAERDKYRDPYFYVGTGFSVVFASDRCWNDDLNLPLKILRDYITKLQRGERLEADVEERVREATSLAEQYRALLKADEQKNTFDQLLPLAKMAMDHCESHMFWGEAQYQPRMFNKLRELSQVFCKYEMLEEPNDIFYLNRYEIPQLIHELTIAWAQRTKPVATWHWKPEIKWRKDIYEKLKEWSPPAFLGKAPERELDTTSIGLYGMSLENIRKFMKQADIRPEEVSELTGFPGAPGITEGVARVLSSHEQIEEIREGEILITKLTSPTWGPAFEKVKAVVTDIGGMLSHAAIIAREYGLPAVVGTAYGSTAVKTGDVVKVDGEKGLVKIVRRA